ncbi:hypothetical protein ACFLVL_01085 [Chloroflexota bacterium]
MEKQPNKTMALISAIKSVPIVVVSCFIAIFIAIAIAGFKWSLLSQVFSDYWSILLLIVAGSFILLYFITRYPFGAIMTVMLSIGIVLVMASAKGNVIGGKIRDYIDTNFELSFLLGSLGVLALILVIQTIRQRS